MFIMKWLKITPMLIQIPFVAKQFRIVSTILPGSITPVASKINIIEEIKESLGYTILKLMANGILKVKDWIRVKYYAYSCTELRNERKQLL
jgi:hypothetical protein